MRNFRKLDIWNLGMEIVDLVYELVKKLPREETYGLRSQMCKCVISMPSNIAEGCSRSSNKDFARFLEISIGSAFELETQILAGNRIGHFTEEDIVNVIPKILKFQKSTNAYRIKLL